MEAYFQGRTVEYQSALLIQIFNHPSLKDAMKLVWIPSNKELLAQQRVIGIVKDAMLVLKKGSTKDHFAAKQSIVAVVVTCDAFKEVKLQRIVSTTLGIHRETLRKEVSNIYTYHLIL